jgi:hypothetical protein
MSVDILLMLPYRPAYSSIPGVRITITLELVARMCATVWLVDDIN